MKYAVAAFVFCLGITVAVAGGYAGGARHHSAIGGVPPGSAGPGARGPPPPPPAGQIFRFVSVHVPPREAEAPRPTGPRVVYAGGPKDTNYNIIFVRAPTPPPPQQTEVILPPAPERKTLVYVLVQKPQILSAEDSVKIKHPAPTQPTKPEVYFVTYKGQGPAAGPGGPEYGIPAPGPVGPEAPQGDGGYGAPAVPPQGSSGGYQAPPQPSYGAPAAQGPAGGYQAPQPSYGAPAPQGPSGGYQAPPQPSYGAPAQNSFAVPAASSGGYA